MAKKKKTLDELVEEALVLDEEQPYRVPGNWIWTKLNIVSMPMISKKPLDIGNSTFRYIDIDAIDNREHSLRDYKIINVNKAPSRASRDVKYNDILFSLVRPYLENIAIIKDQFEDIIASTGFHVSRTYNKILADYIYYYYLSDAFLNMATMFMKGDNSPAIRKTEFEILPIPVAPLKEQERIVYKIESIFDKLDRAKELIAEVREGFEKRKAAILAKAFSGELTEKWREENGVSKDEWKTQPLGKITNIKSSKRIFAKEYVDQGVPFFRSKEVVELNNGTFEESAYYITTEKYNDIKENYGVPNVGDLLVTSVGTIGKTWIVDDRKFYYKDGNLTQVEKCDKLEMKFLQHYIDTTMFKSIISDTVSGSAYNALTIVKFKGVVIPIPSIKEQKEIVRRVDKLLEEESRIEELTDLEENIKVMKKAILAKVFRGELGTNDPDEESALELLKEVLKEKVK